MDTGIVSGKFFQLLNAQFGKIGAEVSFEPAFTSSGSSNYLQYWSILVLPTLNILVHVAGLYRVLWAVSKHPYDRLTWDGMQWSDSKHSEADSLTVPSGFYSYNYCRGN